MTELFYSRYPPIFLTLDNGETILDKFILPDCEFFDSITPLEEELRKEASVN